MSLNPFANYNTDRECTTDGGDMGEIQRDKIDLSLTTNEKIKRQCPVTTCEDNKSGICYADEVCTWLNES